MRAATIYEQSMSNQAQQPFLRNDILLFFLMLWPSLFMFIPAYASPKLLHYTQHHSSFYFIHQHCPTLSYTAIRTGIKAYQTAHQDGLDFQHLLTIVDFTRPSNQKRLCTINMQDDKVLFYSLVSHGRRSGLRYAYSFSNKLGSHKSSIGVYLTGKSYYGVFGYAMRIYGLDKGFNSNAAKRDIVVHSALYVNPKIAKRYHRVGTTWGCFAVEPHLVYRFVNTIRDGSLIVAYYPDKKWLKHSIFLHKPKQINIQQTILALIKQQL